MKKFIPFILISCGLVLMSCQKNDTNPDEEAFPVEMNCIINSIDFFTNNVLAITGSNVIQISGSSAETRVILYVEIDAAPGTYPLDGTTNYAGFVEYIIDNTTFTSDDGFLIIDEKDDMAGEMSGSFQFHGTEFLGYAEVDVIAGTFSTEF